MKKLIQFPHPGPEHQNIYRHKEGNYIRWNKGDHKRKFVKNFGKYIDEDNKIKEADLTFWCEWEPQSKIIKEFSIIDDKNELPKYLQEPMWDSKERVQNTDPFVFGDNFYYAFCKQEDIKTKKLTELCKGDLILFGSRVNQKFRIDTVFLVKRYIEYEWSNYPEKLKDIIEKTPDYNEITLKAGSCNPKVISWKLRFYEAVNYYERKSNNDMYSFIPAKKYDKDAKKGFERPEIDFSKIKDYNCKNETDKLILNGTTMGARVVCIKDDDKIKEIWNTIRKQIKEKQLVEGIYTDIPKPTIVPYSILLNKPTNKYKKIPNLNFSSINELEIVINFKSNKQTGGLIGCQNTDFNPSEYNPVIYIDNSGYLCAKLWDSKLKTLKVRKKVTNNTEYKVIYSANFSTNIQKLELVGFGQDTQTNKILKFNKDTDSDYQTNNWQLGAVFSGAYAGGNSEWFEFNGNIISAQIQINGNPYYKL